MEDVANYIKKVEIIIPTVLWPQWPCGLVQLDELCSRLQLIMRIDINDTFFWLKDPGGANRTF